MRHRFPPSCVLCLALLAAFATQAQGAAKHFRVSYEHFNACASKAADLYFKTNQAGEKNILSHLTAISAIYAEKAYVVMNIVDILEHMAAKRDRAYVLDRLAEVKRETLAGVPQDVKLLADLVENHENQEIRDLGNQVVNEIRVFERNTENL
jgi:hypothetical protein